MLNPEYHKKIIPQSKFHDQLCKKSWHIKKNQERGLALTSTDKKVYKLYKGQSLLNVAFGRQNIALELSYSP